MMSIRITKQKELIIDIIRNSYNHPNAEEIYNKARKVLPNISLGTIYRNLNMLTYNNKIKRINCDDAIYRYDHVDYRHQHFICASCNKIIDIFDDIELEKKIIDGNEVIDYDIYFKGICKECLEKENYDGIKS